MANALEEFLEQFKRVAPALTDSYFVVDKDRRIVDFNRAFYAMLPRPVARQLKGKHCYEVLALNICEDDCIAKQCWKEGRHIRLNEITGRVIGKEGGDGLRFVLSAIPITSPEGEPVGALEIQRNVTDEASVHTKYKTMLESEVRERERLATQVKTRTRELLEANQRLLKTQKELLAYKKGLAV